MILTDRANKLLTTLLKEAQDEQTGVEVFESEIQAAEELSRYGFIKFDGTMARPTEKAFGKHLYYISPESKKLLNTVISIIPDKKLRDKLIKFRTDVMSNGGVHV